MTERFNWSCRIESKEAYRCICPVPLQKAYICICLGRSGIYWWMLAYRCICLKVPSNLIETMLGGSNNVMSRFGEAKTTVVVLLIYCRLMNAQVSAVEWNIDAHIEISSEDKSAIIKLVRDIGVEEPARVSVVYVLPTGGQVLNVESRVAVDGPHRSWVELSVCRKDWKPFHCSTKSGRTVGRWRASKVNLTQRQAWRIQDHDWHLDVSTDPKVPYRDAEQIVLAIRHGQLINRLPTSIGPLRLNVAMPDIDLDEDTYISSYKSEVGTYEVRTGRAGGLLLRVKVFDSGVELQNYGTWLV
jgi:hypothetical protein